MLAYARALLATDTRTIVVDGDVREPGAILDSPELRAHLDFTRPVAVVMATVLHHVPDSANPAGIVTAFAEAMTPGSAPALSHVVTSGNPDRDAADHRAARIHTETTTPFLIRARDQVAAWFDGFRLLSPGLVPAGTWRRPHRNGATPAPVLAAVGIRPDPSMPCP